MQLPVRIFLWIIYLLLAEATAGHNLSDSSGIDLHVLTDSANAAAMNKKAYAMVDEFPDSALYFARQAVTTAKQQRLHSLEADCYKTMGAAFDGLGNMDSCLFYLNQALSLFITEGNKKKQANVLSDIGLAYFSRGIYLLSLKYHLASLSLRKEINDTSLISKSYNNIGLLYKARKDYANAILYYMNSLQLKKLLKDAQGELNTTLNIGSLYQQTQQYDSAYYFADKALQLAQNLHSDVDIAAALSNKGMALQSMNRWNEAVPVFDQSLTIAARTNCVACFNTIYVGMGMIASGRGNNQLALQYYFKGLQASLSTKKDNITQSLYELISSTYRKMHSLHSALVYKDSADAIAAKLLNAENLRQINEMTAVFQTGEKEKIIENLHADSQKNASIANQRGLERNYFIFSSLVLLLLLGGIYFAYRKNNIQKKQLLNQKKVIETASAEKDVLLKEIHHRVKNNLQIISSLLNLQSGYIHDEEAMNAIRDSRNRVQSMALIHRNLYQGDNLTSISIQEYVESLCNDLLVSYQRNGSLVQITKEVQPLMIDVETLIPIGLILNELITNCLKYAFAERAKGQIRLQFFEQNNILHLNVFDDGIGFSEVSPDTHSSFGLRMINAFLQKMNGTMNMYNEEGARIEILIKDYKIQQV